MEPSRLTIMIASGADSRRPRNFRSVFLCPIADCSAASRAFRKAVGLGNVSACGTNFTSKIAVGTDARAVMALIEPESQYVGCQITQISIKGVVPQATMNMAKQRNIQLNGRSLRLRMK